MAQHLKALDDRELHNMRTGARWRRISKRQLKLHPLCEWCRAEGKIVAAEVAHHLTPHRGDRKLMFTGKLVSLCKPCHDGRAQQHEKRGYRCDIGVDGWPTDKHHPVYRR